MKYKKYKTIEEKNKRKKKVLAILLPILITGTIAAIVVPTTLALTKQSSDTKPTPTPTPTPTPIPPYSGPVFKFDGTKLLGFEDRVTESYIIENFPNGSITIPECTEIADGAFDGKIPNGITNLILPSQTTIIGNNSFANNPNITKISFYENKDVGDWELTSLGSQAFYNTGIESFSLPFNLKDIGESCFEKCNNLKYLDLRTQDTDLDINLSEQSFSNIATSGQVLVRPNTAKYWETKLSAAGLSDDPIGKTFSSTWTINEFTCLDIVDGVCYGFKKDIPKYLTFLLDAEAEHLRIPSNVWKISNLYGGFSGYEQIKTLILPWSITSIDEGCFIDCKNINKIDLRDFTTLPSWEGTNLFKGCAKQGKFVIYQQIRLSWKRMLENQSGLDIKPDCWVVGDDQIEKEYCLGVYAQEESYVAAAWNSLLTVDLNYSLDGIEWKPYVNNEYIKLEKGQSIYFQGMNKNGLSLDNDNYVQFSLSGCLTLKGSVMGLLNGGYDELDTIPSPWCFNHLFLSCTGLKNIDPGFLPAKNLTEHCYDAMFYGCESLENAPLLPSTNLAPSCYAWMFYFTNLQDMPVLPATTLCESCYSNMFGRCSQMKTTQKLPAKHIPKDAYNRMFHFCDLIEHIEIEAETLDAEACNAMFLYDKNLKYIKIHFREWTKDSTKQWVAYSATQATIIYPSDLTIPKRSNDYIPTNWLYDTFEREK